MTEQNYQKFWNEKILNWEKIYSAQKSNSIISRKKTAFSLLAENINNLRVLEIGCGSGRLAFDLTQTKLKSYHGIDISEVAIKAAKNRFAPILQENRFTFQVNSLKEINPHSYDCIISLGLVDWLTSNELTELFRISEGIKFLHSFSSKRNTFQRFLHKLYVAVKYGIKENYWPRYYSDKQILSYLAKPQQASILNQKDSFGSFIYRL